MQTPENEINYNFKKYGEDVNLIQNDEECYCLKQCTKMAYYIQQLYHISILRMKCEFMKDDNGTIWFTYAKEVFTRSNEEAIIEKKIAI